MCSCGKPIKATFLAGTTCKQSLFAAPTAAASMSDEQVYPTFWKTLLSLAPAPTLTADTGGPGTRLILSLI